MPRPIPEDKLQAIEEAVRRHPVAVTTQQIARELPGNLPNRTLQYRLKYLVDAGRLARQGQGRWATYRLPGRGDLVAGTAQVAGRGEAAVPLSPEGAEIRTYLSQPVEARKPAGYNRAFLDSYRPNVSFYLSKSAGPTARLSRRALMPSKSSVGF
jgi:hypothetical protein